MYYLISKANKKNHLLLQEHHTLKLMQEKQGSEIDSSNPASRIPPLFVIPSTIPLQ